MVKKELISHAFRKARTRTLIQLGGLLEKAGLLEQFNIQLGTDLQKDLDLKNPVAALYGSLLELAQMNQLGEFNTALLTQKGLQRLANKKD